MVVSSRLHSCVLLEAVDSSLANIGTNKPNTLRSVYHILNSTPRAYLDALDGFWPVCLLTPRFLSQLCIGLSQSLRALSDHPSLFGLYLRPLG